MGLNFKESIGDALSLIIFPIIKFSSTHHYRYSNIILGVCSVLERGLDDFGHFGDCRIVE